MNSYVKNCLFGYKDFFSVIHDCENINDYITFFLILFIALIAFPFVYIFCCLHDLGDFPFWRQDGE